VLSMAARDVVAARYRSSPTPIGSLVILIREFAHPLCAHDDRARCVPCGGCLSPARTDRAVAHSVSGEYYNVRIALSPRHEGSRVRPAHGQQHVGQAEVGPRCPVRVRSVSLLDCERGAGSVLARSVECTLWPQSGVSECSIFE